MSEKGLRFNEGKLKWSYVSWKALEPMVRVLMFGAEKYTPFNWQKGLSCVECTESLLRHLHSMLEGEKIDKESNLPHIGHVLCNAMFISFMLIFRPECDDYRKETEFQEEADTN